MAQSQRPSMVGYYAAMDWLFDNRPHMMAYIASLGAPKNDRRCDRAMVVSGPDFSPRLYADDEFLQRIGPAQAAGVLVHEFRHVLLGHSKELMDPKPDWKYEPVLRDAHEVVINDSLELTGYELPEDVIRGKDRGGHFYGYWTTEDAYGPMEEWYLAQQPQKDESDGAGEDESDEEESGDSSDDGAQQDGDGEASDGQGAGADGSPAEGQQSEGSNSSGSSSNGSPSQGEPNGTKSGDGTGGDSQPTDGGEGASEEQTSGDSNPEDNNPKDADESSEGQGDSADSESSDSEAQEGDGAPGAGEEEKADGDALDSDEHSSSDGCQHGAYIEDENGNLREMSEEELDRFIEVLNEAVVDAIERHPMPEDEKPSENELDGMDQEVAEAVDPDRKSSYSKAGTAPSAAEEVLKGGKLHLGWLKLLQRINPDVGKDDGGMNAKASYNWARPRRSTSLIPGVNLPTPGAPRGQGIGTKQKPIALIALDFSGSIDRRLAYAMKDMAQSIPEEHIEARCFTFSTEAVPFDHRAERNSVAAGGTDFSCIEIEARKIELETGKYPYVICLTDGEAWFGGYSYNGYSRSAPSEPTKLHLETNWLWVDVETEDDNRAFRNGKAYPQVLAQKNLSALPYDRSKL